MNEPTISVAILVAAKVEFILDGYFKVTGAERIYNGKYEAFAEENNIIIKQGEHILNIEGEIIFQPHEYESDSFVIKNVVIGKSFHWEQKETQRFQGNLKITVENNQIAVINLIPTEDYLKSVISSEMSATATPEFLKAHAIISRSWLMAQLERKIKPSEKNVKDGRLISEDEIFTWYDREDHKLYDFCADDHCQRYQGISKVQNKNVNNAIKDTYGMVLHNNNRICDTRFSKCCGGISESFENVWQNENYEYLDSVIDYKFEPDNYDFNFGDEKNAEKWIKNSPQAFCNCNNPQILNQVLVNFDQETTDFYRWKIVYTQNEICQILNKKTGYDFGFVKNIIPLERGKSGRLIKIKIVGTKKELTVGKELEIRRILSDKHLYSSAFVISKEKINENGIPEEIILTGAGWGHGVGLCQIGAAVMGEIGYKFDEILLHYFKNSIIKKIY